MRSRFKNDESNEISPGYESTIKESNTYEESRKVTDYENSKSIYIKEKEFQNKVYVEEINLNDLMDSNVKYLNTDNSGNLKIIFLTFQFYNKLILIIKSQNHLNKHAY